MELSPEQIKVQEIHATTGTMGWQYLVEDFEAKIREFEDVIHDINVDDTPKYSERSILIAQVNCLRTFISKPERLIETLQPL